MIRTLCMIESMEHLANLEVDALLHSKPHDVCQNLRRELDMHDLSTKFDNLEDSWANSLSNLNVRDAANGSLTLAHASWCEAGDILNRPAVSSPPANRRDLHVVTWNVAAPNNNSFEYWVTHESDEYVDLMTSVQRLIDEPGERDISVGKIFTEDLFQQLRAELVNQGVPDLEQLDGWWREMSERKAISGFLKDRTIGEKRLISMPDRVTNSIRTDGGMMFRPSPISGSQVDVGDVTTWWSAWKQFMFSKPVWIKSHRGCERIPSVFAMLEPIPRAKYPALTEREAAASVPLQALCLAIFDAVLVHLLFLVAPDTWQPLKRSLHKLLYEDKIASCTAILERQYGAADVIFLQEASPAFVDRAAHDLPGFAVLLPDTFDERRCQNSVVLVSRRRFAADGARDLTAAALDELAAAAGGGKRSCAQAGDLCAFAVTARDGGQYVLASFHGDSAGGATCPALAAVRAFTGRAHPDHTLVIGLDANTTSHAAAGLPAAQFRALLPSMGLAACWTEADVGAGAGGDCAGAGAGRGGVWTTCSARTFLQPQLQKAVRFEELPTRRSTDLKDWVLFDARRLRVAGPAARDNTGAGGFRDAAMPSRVFPSDHAIVSVHLSAAAP